MMFRTLSLLKLTATPILNLNMTSASRAGRRLQQLEGCLSNFKSATMSTTSSGSMVPEGLTSRHLAKGIS